MMHRQELGSTGLRVSLLGLGCVTFGREIEGWLLPLCRERRIGVLAYSPLAAGFLTGKYRRGGPVPEGGA